MSLNIDQITQIDEIQIVDANGNLAVVKPASTAALSTDTSLVVALSPNSPLPAGSSTIGSVTQSGTWTVQQGTPPWTMNLTLVGGSAIALGQTTMAASLPVAIASNQSAIPVSQSGAWTVAATQSGTWSTGRTWTLASGTDSVSAVQSTSPWIVQDNASNTSGAAAANRGLQVMGVFNTTPATLATGESGFLQLDSSQNLLINLKTALPAGSNNIGSVNQGTSPWIVKDQADGSATGGTAGSFSMLVGGIYNPTPPTLTAGQQVSIQLSSGGALLTEIVNATPLSVDATQVGTWTVQQGTPPWSVVGNVASGSADSGDPVKIGGVYNSTAPILASGERCDVQMSSVGEVLIATNDDLFPTSNITVQDTSSTSTIGNNQQVIYAGTPTAGSVASIALTSDQAVVIEVSGTWTGTLQTEISMDGGTTWVIRPTNQSGTVYLASAFTANFVSGGCIAGYTNFRVRAISAMTGTAVVRFNTSSNTNTIYIGNVVQSAPTDGTKQTYSASSASLVPATTTPSDIFTITGSATKTIRVTRVSVSATQTTVAALIDVLLILRSAANTGGTSTSPTIASHDSQNAAATATIRQYTANPSALGASAGTVRSTKMTCTTNAPGNAQGAVTTIPIVWDFGNRPGQAIVLRGTAQVLAVNLNSVTLGSAGSFDISMEWTEE
jgi:hypothetical protein